MHFKVAKQSERRSWSTSRAKYHAQISCFAVGKYPIGTLCDAEVHALGSVHGCPDRFMDFMGARGLAEMSSYNRRGSSWTHDSKGKRRESFDHSPLIVFLPQYFINVWWVCRRRCARA
jgi:hypothetical protein